MSICEKVRGERIAIGELDFHQLTHSPIMGILPFHIIPTMLPDILYHPEVVWWYSSMLVGSSTGKQPAAIARWFGKNILSNVGGYGVIIS